MTPAAQLDRLRCALAGEVPPSSDFDLNPGTAPDLPSWRPAAVLAVIEEKQGALNLVLTRRAAHLKHHPGQVAFPGGKVEADDESPATAAEREAFEEIGLPLGSADILGELSPHRTVTGFEIRPFLAHVTQPWDARIDPAEVDELFRVPLSHILDPENFLVQSRKWMGVARYYHTVPFGPYYIWGATARMLRGLAERYHACG